MSEAAPFLSLVYLTLHIPSLARKRCYQAGILGGPQVFFFL